MATPTSSACLPTSSWAAYGSKNGRPEESRRGARVIASHDEVGGAVVLSNDRMQQGLSWTGHPHGERQQGQNRGGRLEVPIEKRLIRPNAGEVVDVSGPGEPHDRVQENRRVVIVGGPLDQLLVRPMERVAGLKGHDVLDSSQAATRPRTSAGLSRREVKSACGTGFRCVSLPLVALLDPARSL